MNTANKITMIRVVLVPIFMVLFMIDNVTCHYAALGVFVLASITDAIDGHVARSIIKSRLSANSSIRLQIRCLQQRHF